MNLCYVIIAVAALSHIHHVLQRCNARNALKQKKAQHRVYYTFDRNGKLHKHTAIKP